MVNSPPPEKIPPLYKDLYDSQSTMVEWAGGAHYDLAEAFANKNNFVMISNFFFIFHYF